MDLEERKFMILQAIIDDYIATAMPVGSRTISRKAGVGYSPATIRNEMSDLEALGYLDQPHTSAGRVPSVKAYRLYVDHLMKTSRLSEAECEKMHEYLFSRSGKMQSVIKAAAEVLSDITHYTSVIVTPGLRTLRIKHVQLVPVNEETALMIIVTNASIVRDAVIHIPDGLDADELYMISRTLTERLRDKPMEAVRQAFSELLREAEINRKLLGETLKVIENRVDADDSSDVVIAGGTNLLNYPEYSDVDKAKQFLLALESRDVLSRLIKQTGGMEVTIRIGPENGVPELSDCSTVTCSYRVGGENVGTIGVIGPTRMNYNRTASVLGFMGQALSEVLANRK